ncbi:NPCBM/NEW2 domain-containing protein [Ruminiclostridium sufflavum DSM 19573]|uniref:NPCBM/NEW2 domain-containing protein n=1 Tax=Ruminiclostridium sufflavum DSM 19573 TaxID=1121337 RepID=A0A318XU68_9FIRM|nr:NPCBM/NEW2 domain-containing protein [Ruminiclostridium sufflavum]PYG90393.1 NPCBM/NEW2 domain-containing protein [Ruminiclostridium sufflavum DSM 19573]
MDCLGSWYTAPEKWKGKDNTGIVYEHGIYAHSEKQDTGSIEYLLNQKYSIIKGKIVLADDSKNRISDMVIKIYGDGELLYTSNVLTAGMLPQQFNLDTAGVIKLNIKYEKLTSTDYGIGFGIVDCGFYE